MFRRTRSQALKESAASATDFASALAKDRKFRKELLSAISHGTIARRRAARRIGIVAAVTPVTNPIVTPMCNAMFAIKTGNAVIFAPHPLLTVLHWWPQPQFGKKKAEK